MKYILLMRNILILKNFEQKEENVKKKVCL